MTWERNNDGKVLMWGEALGQTHFPRGAVERGGNGSNGVGVGHFTPARYIGASRASGNRGCPSAPEDGPSLRIVGDVGGSRLEVV